MTASSTVLNRTLGWHRPLMLFSAAMVLLVPVALVGLVVDDRVLAGAPIWLKPLKFALSFVLYGPTLVWMISLLQRHHRWGMRMGTVATVTGAVEMTLLVGQVIRGKQSHFNVETPLDTAIYAIMGGVIAVFWVSNLVIAVLLLRERLTDRPTAWAIRLGLLIALGGMAIGFLMTNPTADELASTPITRAGAHTVGLPDGGPGLPLTGWSTVAGDLRIPHFAGIHTLQVLPLIALGLAALAPRFARLRDERTRLRLVVVAAAGYAGLVTILLWQALRGQSLVQPDALTLSAFAALVVAIGAAAVLVLRPASTVVSR